MNYLTTHISLSPIRRGFAPGFVNYKKGCTRLAATFDKVYQLLVHGRWFSPASSPTKTGRHDIAEILLKVALNTINQCKSIICYFFFIIAVKYNEEKEEKSKQEAKQKKLQQIEDAKKLEAEKGMIYVYRS